MATVLHNRFGRDVRLTDERITHILEHEKMVGQLGKVEETVREPDVVVRSQRDAEVHLYHKHYLQDLRSMAVNLRYFVACLVFSHTL